MADQISPKLTDIGGGVYDWEIVNGRSAWVEDADQAAQHTLERMQISYGESDSHPKLGMKIFQIILAADKSRAEKEFEIKQTILKTPGNLAIIKLGWEQTGRELVLTGAIKHKWGITNINETLTFL